MSILEGAVQALRSAQASAMSVPVVYRRRDGSESKVEAVVGRTVFHTRGEYGTWARTEARDFIVRAEILPFDPVSGDEIVFAGRTYEVLAPNNEHVWRWSDPWFTARRIHTKLVEG